MGTTSSPWALALIGPVLIALGAALLKYREKYAALWGRIFGPRVVERAGGSERYIVVAVLFFMAGSAFLVGGIARLF
jgi:hypothetical protein